MYDFDYSQEAIEYAVSFCGCNVPPSYIAICVAYEKDAALPTGIVVRTKASPVPWLSVGNTLRSIDPKLIKKQDKPKEKPIILSTYPAGTKSRWTRQANKEDKKLADWIYKRVESSGFCED